MTKSHYYDYNQTLLLKNDMFSFCVCALLQLVLEMINGRLMEVKAFVLILYVLAIVSGCNVMYCKALLPCVYVRLTERVECMCDREREQEHVVAMGADEQLMWGRWPGLCVCAHVCVCVREYGGVSVCAATQAVTNCFFLLRGSALTSALSPLWIGCKYWGRSNSPNQLMCFLPLCSELSRN